MNPPTRILIQTSRPFVRDFGARPHASERLHEVWVRYCLPVLTVCAAIAATLLLSHVTKESRSSAVFFLAAVMVSAWYGGVAAGFFAIALSVLSIDFYFLKPTTAYALSVYDIPLIVVFCSLAAVISYLVDFRRRAETQLRQANDQLEQRVVERTKELAEANRIKDEFLAMVTHDLRAPLTSILGWVEIIEQDGIKNESLARALAVIKRNALAQNDLVSDLLDLTGMATGGFKLNVTSVDLRQLLDSVKERFRPIAAGKGITLSFSINERLPPIEADSHRIVQVLDNLLSNAIKFTQAGGSVDAKFVHAEDHMRIVVSDTGEGIAPELLPHIFEPFRQEKTDHARQGLGLGLSIVKRIVDAHGGTIDVQSPGVRKGSVFVLTLPLKNDADEVTLVRGIASRNSTTSSGTRIQDSLPVNSIQDHAPVGLMAG